MTPISYALVNLDSSENKQNGEKIQMSVGDKEKAKVMLQMSWKQLGS